MEMRDGYCWDHGGYSTDVPDCPDCAQERHTAIVDVLNVIRHPLRCMSLPEREAAAKKADRFNITARDLLDLAVSRARNT